MPTVSPETPKNEKNNNVVSRGHSGCTNAVATGASSREGADFYLPIRSEGMSVAESVPETPKRNNLSDAEKRGLIDDLLAAQGRRLQQSCRGVQKQSVDNLEAVEGVHAEEGRCRP